MTALLIFALVLYVAVLSSCLAERTAASVAVLFIVAGFVVGPGGVGWVAWSPQAPVVEHLATWALVAVLFSDGARIGAQELRAAWRLPGRALLLGLPLTLVLIAVLARWLTGFDWGHAFLLAAVLTPTDPVFASAIVGRSQVAKPLRRLLNVESGVNDGLALPVVLVLIALLGHEPPHAATLLGEVVSGAAIGLALPWVARALRPRRMRMSSTAEPLYGLALGLLAFALAEVLHANSFLATFFAGVGFASADPALRDRYHELGEQLGEVLKLAALLVFGALLSPGLLASLQPADHLFAAATLLVARPLGLLLALLGSGLGRRDRLAAAWFGPKGFASLVYAILVLRAQLPEGQRLYEIAAVVIAASIVAHSSTDVPMSRWLSRPRSHDKPHHDER
ncbi:MAG: cation:proton antiporter [Rhizobacter sp.]|nr:cation:proton antiporter [Rhizobacter sp.]